MTPPATPVCRQCGKKSDNPICMRCERAAGAGAQVSATHTPLPWGISYGFNLDFTEHAARYVAGSDPKSVGIKIATPWIAGAWDTDPEAAANAEFIVRACNAHYDLIEALEHILDGALSLPRFAEEEGRAAIAKARGDQ